MNHFQLARLFKEIIPRVTGGFVRKIYQPERFCLQIGIFAGGSNQWLTVWTAPGLGCCYLAADRITPSEEHVGDFYLKLRSALKGLCLTELSQVENERIIRLRFAPAKGGRVEDERRLVLELFSAAGNCFLLDAGDLILSVMHPAAARGRKNRPGSAYVAPQPLKTPLQAEGEDPLLRLIEERSLPDYNTAVALHFEKLAHEKRLETEKLRLKRIIEHRRKKLERAASHQQRTISQAERADWYRECGEILSANFRSLKRGLEKIRLPDLFAADNLTLREIPLAPALAPDKNLDRYFRKYKKLKRGAEFAAGRLKEIGERLSLLDKLNKALAGASTLTELGELSEQLTGRSSAIKPAGKKELAQKHLPYRKFTSADGSEILVGKGGKDNDELTFHVARGRDLWLHVSGAKGAHVVLVCPQEGHFSEQALLDAAHLAVFYSSLKKEPFADVDYTYRKHLRRPRGQAPGKAIMAQRKTIHLRLEPKRLERLLERDF